MTQEQNLQSAARKKTLRGTVVLTFGTLVSRLLGMLRDTATAAMLGMSAGGVMDAFVLAFRLPDFARRLFSDGSLSVSFIPVFSRAVQHDKYQAKALLYAVLIRFFIVLTGIVVLGEFLCGVAVHCFPADSRVHLAAHLLSVLLPYLILVSLAAICSASLQTIGKFAVSVCVPMILNIIWLAGILFVIPIAKVSDAETQCYILAVCILVAGALQLLIHVPFVRYFHSLQAVSPSVPLKSELHQVFRRLFPQLFGLMSVQLNLLVASVIAYLFSGHSENPVVWLNGVLNYPLRPGAAAAIYYSERLFEFPQGLLGLAVAVSFYPLMTRHAAHKHTKAVGEDVTLGLRLCLVFAIPTGAGLVLLSEKLVHLLFQRGAFSACDTMRTADMLFWFGSGVWAFCVLPLIIRAYYTLGSTRIPVKAAAGALVLNVLLSLFLMCWMEEQGLAAAASICASLQALALIVRFSTKYKLLDWRVLLISVCRSMIATVFMSLAVTIVMKALPGNSSLDDVLHIVLSGIVGGTVFLFTLRFLGGRELDILVRGKLKRDQ